MAAAASARRCRAEVTIIDENPSPGGQIWRGEGRTLAPGTDFIGSARVISGDASSRTLLIETPGGARYFAYDKLVLATGSRELFLPFPGWTLPGIFGVGGLQALAKSGLPLRGKRIAVAGSGPLLLAGAAYFRKHGAHVSLIAEQAALSSVARFGVRLWRWPSKAREALRIQTALLGVPQMHNCWIEAAEGNERLERLQFRHGKKRFSLDVDYAAVAWGLVANNELAGLLGCQSVAGVGGADVSAIEGEIAGLVAAGREDLAEKLASRREKAHRFAHEIERCFGLRPELRAVPRPQTIICRCEDIPFGRLQTFDSFRAAKLHTRCGMGPCQGRICGPAAQFLFGWRDESVRPPILAARVGTLAAPPAESAQ
jgi:NADPH-dependent 2,4-dienoyl-CoA reductase/sulfur reductase-like enzyme